MNYIQNRADFIASCVVNIPIDITILISTFLHSEYNDQLYDNLKGLLRGKRCRFGSDFRCNWYKNQGLSIPIKYVEGDWDAIHKFINNDDYLIHISFRKSHTCKKRPDRIYIGYLALNQYDPFNITIYIQLKYPICQINHYVFGNNIIFDGVIKIKISNGTKDSETIFMIIL